MENPEAYHWGSIIAAIVLTASAIILSVRTSILKDTSAVTPKPYSYARFQLMWWLVIIADAYMLAYGWSGDMVALTTSCLVLLGISAGTTATGRIIDNSRTDDDNAVTQNQPSEGFIKDILSDQNGISVHRFQSLVFNLIFGIIFLVKFFNSLKTTPAYPDFSETDLALMGISSAAYIGLKLGENSSTAPAQNPVTPNPAPAPPANPAPINPAPGPAVNPIQPEASFPS